MKELATSQLLGCPFSQQLDISAMFVVGFEYNFA